MIDARSPRLGSFSEFPQELRLFGTAAAAPIGASTLQETVGSMAVSHGAAYYPGYGSPPAQSHLEPSFSPGASQGQDTGYLGCAFRSPEVGSLSILVHLVCCDIGSGPSAGAPMSLIPLLLARDSGSLFGSFCDETFVLSRS